MTLIEAEERALKILKQVMEEKVSSTNVEVCVTKYLNSIRQCACSFCRWHQLKWVASLNCMIKKSWKRSYQELAKTKLYIGSHKIFIIM